MFTIPPEAFFVFGGRSTALEIAETIGLSHPGHTVVHVVGNEEDDSADNHVRLADLQSIWQPANRESQYPYILSMANHQIRVAKRENAEALGLKATTVIHPDATLMPSASIAPGCYIAAGARISSQAKIGPHSVINYNVIFGHDSCSGIDLVINPGASIGGNVAIGQRVLIGANSFIFQGTSIGDDCQVDAMTYVNQAVPDAHIASCRARTHLPRPGFSRTSVS